MNFRALLSDFTDDICTAKIWFGIRKGIKIAVGCSQSVTDTFTKKMQSLC